MDVVTAKNGALRDPVTGRIVGNTQPAPMSDPVFQRAASEKARTRHSLAKSAGVAAEVVINRVFQIAKGEL